MRRKRQRPWEPAEMPLPSYWPRLWHHDYRRWWHAWLTGTPLRRLLMTGDWRQP